MTEFQFSCLVLVLFCFVVLIAFLLYRCANLQGQIDEMRHDMQRMRMKEKRANDVQVR